MKCQYESEILYKLMERDGFNIPSSVPPYESEIKAYLINQVKQAYPKLTDYEAEWLLYNYTKHLPADFPISSVSDVMEARFENVVPFAYQSAILKGSTKYRDIDTGDVLDTFDETKNLELVSVKMPVLTTTGKNVCDMVDLANKLNKIDNKIAVINESTWEITSSSSYIDFKYRVKFKENTSYTLSFEGQTTDNNRTNLANIIQINYTDGTSSKMRSIGFNKLTTPSNKTIDYICFTYGVMGIKETISNLSIIEGESTSYEPYKSNILTVNEPIELRGIGNVQDTLDCLTGEVIERIGEVVLDGRESWVRSASSDNKTDTSHFYLNITNLKENSPLLCDKFLEDRSGYTNYEKEGIKINTQLWININKDRLSNDTNEGLKKYLSQNPVTVQYQLATESIKTVELSTVNEKGESTYFMPLEGTMSVQSSGEIIQPTFDMTVPVEATTQNLASFIDLEME